MEVLYVKLVLLETVYPPPVNLGIRQAPPRETASAVRTAKLLALVLETTWYNPLKAEPVTNCRKTLCPMLTPWPLMVAKITLEVTRLAVRALEMVTFTAWV